MTTQPIARDRHGVEILSYEHCMRLLAGREVGRIGYTDAGTPVIVPVNYALDGPWVVFRSTLGSKLDAVTRGRPLAFEVDDADPVTRSGWSVLVTGVPEVVDTPAVVERLEASWLDSWALADRREATWVRLRTDTVTGRRLRGPVTADTHG